MHGGLTPVLAVPVFGEFPREQVRSLCTESFEGDDFFFPLPFFSLCPFLSFSFSLFFFSFFSHVVFSFCPLFSPLYFPSLVVVLCSLYVFLSLLEYSNRSCRASVNIAKLPVGNQLNSLSFSQEADYPSLDCYFFFP